MEQQPERLPDRQPRRRPPTPEELARMAESRRALDRRSETSGPGDGPGAPGGRQGSGGGGQSGGRQQGPGGAAQPGGPGGGGRPGPRPQGPGGAMPPDARRRQGPGGPGPSGAQPQGPGNAPVPANRPAPPRGPGAPSGQMVPAILVPPGSPPPQGGDRLPVPVQPLVPKPMSDLTATIPILIPPVEESDVRNPPPGELGHFHSDTAGRHRGGSRAPRGLVIAGVFTAAVAVGLALSGAFDGGSGGPAADAQAGGHNPALGGAVSTAPSSPDASTTATDASSPTVSSTTSHSHPPSLRPTTTSNIAPTEATRPSSTPSRTPTPSNSPATSAPTSAPFTGLGMGDTGPAVSQLQADLITAGYGWALNGYQDGVFDKATHRAVGKFQQDHPWTLNTDNYGYYGPATDQALRAAVGG